MCRERRRAQQLEGAVSQVLAGPKWGVDAPDEKMSCSRGSWTFWRQLTGGGRKSDISRASSCRRIACKLTCIQICSCAVPSRAVRRPWTSRHVEAYHLLINIGKFNQRRA